MKRIGSGWVIGMIGAGALAAGLAGCGGSGSASSNASLRLANATLTHASLNLLVNSATAGSAIALDNAGDYVTPASGGVTLQINDAATGTALGTIVPTLTGGTHTTLVAYESGGVVKTTLLAEDSNVPAVGVATLRVIDAASEAGRLDVYVTAADCSSASLASIAASGSFTPSSTTPLTLTQGTGPWNVCVTGQGSKTDLRMSLPLTLASQQVVNVLLTPAAGGQLLNGALLLQQGAFSMTRNPNTRVRLAAAVSGGATVAASASGGQVIDSGSRAPAFGFYTLVPAGNSLNISVNGASVGAPSTALTPGGDATLLVYGGPGSATATLLADDNSAPLDLTTTKLRLINGVTGSAGTLTLTANSAPVGIAIAPGAASTYASVAGSTAAMGLTLISSTAGTFAVNTSNTLAAGTTYSILAAGDIAAPQLLPRGNQ